MLLYKVRANILRSKIHKQDILKNLLGKTMTNKGFGYNAQLPYEQLKKDFDETVRNPDIFEAPKIKIIRGQTGLGKSYLQDKEMPTTLKEVFPELKFIIRVSPTTEVANDGTFEDVQELDSNGIQYFYCENPSPSFIKQFSRLENSVICISTTHAYFSQNFDRLVELAPKSVVIIEEAHQYVGCADAGNEAYVTTYGYSTEYGAKSVTKFLEWCKINPRILGFTATVTRHHEGDASLSDQFIICNKMQPKINLIASQSWLGEVTQYHFAKFQGPNSIQKSVHDSIELILQNENELLEIKENEDPRVNTKLTGLYMAGTNTGTWGSTIDDTREVIANYLIGLNYPESEKMIATMTDKGIRVWDLKGDSVTIPKNDSEELIRRLEDPSNPLRFVVVVNRARSGINVHNFRVEVVCRLRDPREIRTLIPIQSFGRLIRINVGTGDIIRKEFKNNITEYILGYSKKYNVPIETVIRTIKITNTFDIWIPHNEKVKRTWQESIIDFKKDYANMKEDGYRYLDSFLPESEISTLPFDLTIQVPCNGKLIDVKLNDTLKEWKGDGTLDKFFNIS